MDRPGAAKSLAMWIYDRTRTRTGMQRDDDVDPSQGCCCGRPWRCNDD